ncbi:MAG: 5-methylthioadenosine/S-adenosylhomocysteine deaminase [Bradyrhizobium sp.]|jgi:cytosine/adenosine deaminase-related metal-dependent hydrolase|nr:5-methylthioadenosine/S-adenosylhomocysteine deaminase [Bradyrhizobium sp.]
MRISAILFVTLYALLSQPALGQNRILLNGNVVTPSGVIENGWVYIDDNKIVSVTQAQPSVQASVVQSDDYIYPGFVDLHNHPIYNVFPRWTPPQLYNNRYEWRRAPVYQSTIQKPESDLIKADEFCDMDEFSEIKELMGGTTTVIGISKPVRDKPIPGCIQGLARNLDWYTGFYGTSAGQEPVANAIGITPKGYPLIAPDWQGDMTPDTAKEYVQKLKSGTLKLFVIHVAEGKRTDPEAQSEFGLLKDAELLTPKTVIVHGVGLGTADFADMAKIGASLVWSPRSNIVLYGETSDVVSALQQGVRVVLAPDWSPTGSTNMLAELRYANDYSGSKLNGSISPKQLFEMATSLAASIAGIDQWVGSVAEGKFADVFMMKKNSSDAYRNLVSGSPSDVTLVIVNGVPVYGTGERLMQAGVSDIEDITVCAEKRALNSKALTNGSFSNVVAQLTTKLANENSQLGPIAECN